MASLLQRELALIIARDLNDSRINSVAITDVTVSRDLRQATVYVSSVDGTAASREIERQLNNAAGFLRRLLSQSVHLRLTPRLLFKYDSSIQHGVKMTRLIDRLNQPGQPPPDSET